MALRPPAWLAWALLSWALPIQSVHAQSTETKDPTRLDVERLPPEAIALQRDMFESGPYLQAMLGGRGFVGGLGTLCGPGVLTRIGGGYELTDWFAIGAAVELSLHDTIAPAPPSPSSLQLIDAVAELRLRLPLSVRTALFLSGEGGISSVLGNGLESYGVPDADSVGLTYGGHIGFDLHMLSPHHSLGLIAGARFAPNLDPQGGDKTVALGGAAYLAYVF